MRLASRLAAAAGLIGAHRDVLAARPAGSGVPAALDARGWTGFLADLGDASVDAFEIAGLDADWSAAPPSLAAMVAEARAVCAVPELTEGALGRDAPRHRRASRRGETPRKSAQIDAFAWVLLPIARDAGRIVDVGSGHGHLTRELEARLARPVLGLERDVRLTARARSLGGAFAETDVLRDGLPLEAGDCVVGLHACGELGDVMVRSAAEHRASIALVGCCLQKRRDDARVPLSEAEPVLATRLLGLSNLVAREEGVEASRADNLAARARRLALHRLLVERVGPLRLGAEMDGLNRRAAHADLSTLVERAFARRALAVPSAADVRAADAWAREEHARARRLSLPRALLARVLEVFVLADRACFLEAHDREVVVGRVFPAGVSARNLALVSR
ncbi:MAG: methyltransferase [Deltaproteobacteria bacterium]|nr:methyltransferase [Deltaproteobacteria bacterium]